MSSPLNRPASTSAPLPHAALVGLAALVFSTPLAWAWDGTEVDFPGEDQGWTLATDSTKYTGPDGSTEWFRYEFTATATDPNYEFKMVLGNDWAQDFGGNLGFRPDQTDVLYYQPTGDTAAQLAGGTTAGKVYRFQIKDPGLADSFPAAMEISAAPVGITSAGRNPSTGLITVGLSGAPSPEEKVYIRYSSDAWATSEVIPATVAGSTATATIPDLFEGRSYSWYALTSTAHPSRFHNGYATDALTLAWDNNGGSNYSFTTPSHIGAAMVNGISANYTTTKFFIDEIAGDSEDVVVDVAIGGSPAAVQVVTNLNNRGRTDLDDDADGVADGILAPPRDTATVGGPGYFTAHDMAPGGSGYLLTLPASKTGTYRLTVRYRLAAGGPWFYYNGRDHAVVVTPKKALEMTLYELNTLNVEASSNSSAGRSTFLDLLGAAEGDNDGYDHFDLNHLDFIQANCLWFQPIHPTGGDGVEDDPATGLPYVPGSPYATKDFFAVNPHMGSAGTEADALAEFQNFVSKCDSFSGSVGPVNVMLDYVANHSAWDAVFGQGGVDLGLAASAAEKIPPSYYSHQDDYGIEATYYGGSTNTDIAPAPDRFDFGKWADVSDFYYGRYSALQRYDDGSDRHNNEDDYFERHSLGSDTIDLWRLIGYYPEFWLAQTGHSLSNSTAADGDAAARLALDDAGIDALRCDFGQGLPNPLWEYIVNRTRAKKWNFVFMAETLDGGNPGYRSNRVFDILNENMVFQFTQTQENNESALQAQLENRRNTYRTGAILLNLTSHDEVFPDDDPWVTATRYGLVSSVYGLPMVFYGQEKGAQNYNVTNPTYDGFTDHELNFGKWVPHFKRWNQLSVWTSPPPFATGLDQWYGQVNYARLNSPALTGLDQWYLDAKSGGAHEQLWAVAKSEQTGVSPAFGDVVLAFANLFVHGATHASQANTFDLAGSGDALWNFLGMDVTRSYNVRNIASGNAAALLWATPKTGQDLHDNGVFVSLGGGTANPITDDGELVQYLRLVDVTPPPSPLPMPPSSIVLGTGVTFNWSPNGGPHDNITHYLVDIGTSYGANDVVADAIVPFGSNSYSFTGIHGSTYYATVTAVSAAGVTSTSPGRSDDTGPDGSSPTTPVLVLDPAGDADGDCFPNASEVAAGTDPLDATDYLRITNVATTASTVSLTYATVPGRTYFVESSGDLTNPTWVVEDEPSAAGTTAAGSSETYVDLNPTGAQKFYRVRVSDP